MWSNNHDAEQRRAEVSLLLLDKAQELSAGWKKPALTTRRKSSATSACAPASRGCRLPP